MASLFEKFKKGLAKTRESFVEDIVSLVKSQYQIDADLIDQIEEKLITADIGVETALEVIDRLKNRVNNEGFNDQQELITFLKNDLASSLRESGNGKDSTVDTFFNPEIRPFVILVAGVNGTGKTTTIAKLAKVYRDQGKRVLLAAADTFRAAASEQLEIWAKRARVDVVRAQEGADPAAVAFDALKAAIAREVDVLIVDTAGRLHTKTNLMEELKKIHRVLGKVMDSAPHEVFMVLDASTGQNGLAQAKKFKETIDITGIVVTKLDGTAKGGIVLAIQKELNIPVRFIGLGESMDDLKPFEADTFIEALFA